MFGAGAQPEASALIAAEIYSTYNFGCLVLCAALSFQPLEAFDWVEHLSWRRCRGDGSPVPLLDCGHVYTVLQSIPVLPVLAMPRRAQIDFLAWFLTIVAGVPFSQAAIELGRGQWPKAFAIFDAVPTQTNLRAYEKALETASVVAQAVRPRLQVMRRPICFSDMAC